MWDSPELEQRCHRSTLCRTGRERQARGSDGLKELFPDRALGSPVKEGEEKRGGRERNAGEGLGERPRRRLE